MLCAGTLGGWCLGVGRAGRRLFSYSYNNINVMLRLERDAVTPRVTVTICLTGYCKTSPSVYWCSRHPRRDTSFSTPSGSTLGHYKSLGDQVMTKMCRCGGRCCSVRWVDSYGTHARYAGALIAVLYMLRQRHCTCLP